MKKINLDTIINENNLVELSNSTMDNIDGGCTRYYIYRWNCSTGGYYYTNVYYTQKCAVKANTSGFCNPIVNEAIEYRK